MGCVATGGAICVFGVDIRAVFGQHKALAVDQ
jgi:hypothetical protein